MGELAIGRLPYTIRFHLGAGAVALVFGLIYALPLLRADGVPAFQQDWLWPAWPQQCAAFSLKGASPWISGGTGLPASYPQPWWPYLVAGSLCSALGPKLALVAYIGCVVFVGAYLAIRLFSFVLGPFSAIAAAAILWGSPVPLNEIQAGHWFFLTSYAVAPLVLETAFFATRRWAWLHLGVLLGVASAQQQFFPLLTAALLGIGFSRRNLLSATLPAILVGVAVVSPLWISAVLLRQDAALSTIYTFGHWIDSQSAPLSDALRMIGYIGGYDAGLLNHATRLALWLLPVSSIAFAIFKCRIAAVRNLGLICVVSVLLYSGTRGPLSGVIDWAFIHIHPVNAFRELYIFNVVTVFSYAFLTGSAINTLLRHTRYRILGIFLWCVFVGLSMVIMSRSTIGMSTFTTTAFEQRAVNAIAQKHSWGRFIVDPAIEPVRRPSGESRGGYSPWLLPIGLQWSGADYGQTFPSMYVARGLSAPTPDRVANAAFQRIGITDLISDPALVSTTVVEPALRNIYNRWPIQSAKVPGVRDFKDNTLVSVEPYSAKPGTFASNYSGVRTIDPVTQARPLDLMPLAEEDPRESWSPLAFWPTLPVWAYAEPNGIFTLRATARLSIATDSFIAAGNTDGHLTLSGCVSAATLDGHFRLFRCAKDPVFSGAPPIVVSQVFEGGALATTRPQTGAMGTVHIRQILPWQIRLDAQIKGGSALVLRQSFNDLWACDSCGGRHIAVDGFANAWVMPADFKGPLTLTYRGAYAYFLGLTLSLFFIINSFLATVLGGIRGLAKYVSTECRVSAPES